VTERYAKAIEQLGSDKLEVRIGGIYALERIARDSARDHPTVMEVLAAFVREHSLETWPLPAPGTAPSEHRRRSRRLDQQLQRVAWRKLASRCRSASTTWQRRSGPGPAGQRDRARPAPYQCGYSAAAGAVLRHLRAVLDQLAVALRPGGRERPAGRCARQHPPAHGCQLTSSQGTTKDRDVLRSPDRQLQHRAADHGFVE
jgi:hypothetical protein